MAPLTVSCPTCGRDVIVDLSTGPLYRNGDHAEVDLIPRPRDHHCPSPEDQPAQVA